MTKCEVMNEKNQWLLWDPIFGYCNECKNQRVLWDPICGYCNEWKTSDYHGTLYAGIAMNEKPMTIMGPYMQVLQWMKNQWLLWDPICEYCNEWKTNDYYGTLYAGIAVNVKTNNYYEIFYAGITLNVNNQELLRDLICEYCIECKEPTTFIRPLWGYCIFVNGLMKVIIKNDVSIICLKCVYCFKSF